MDRLTVVLRDRAVLAKRTKHGVSAKTYSNLTQAQRAAEKVGGCAFRFPGGRPFYVWITTIDTCPPGGSSDPFSPFYRGSDFS